MTALSRRMDLHLSLGDKMLKAGRAALGLSYGSCFELQNPGYFGSDALYSISKAQKSMILCFRPVMDATCGLLNYEKVDQVAYNNR